MDQYTDPLNRTIVARALNPVSLLLPPAVLTSFGWATRTNEISAVATLCAHLIIQMAWASYLLWRNQKRGGLPVFAMVASAYWVYFAVELFWGERTMLASRNIAISEETVTQTMAMALLAVVSMFGGMNIPIHGLARAAKRLPDIDQRAKTSLTYVGIVIALGALASFFPAIVFMFGAEGRQPMTILTSVVPSVGFALILRQILVRPTSGGRTLVIAIGGSEALGSLASGWLGPLVALGMTVLGVLTVVRRKVPWTTIVVMASAVLFLQAGKNAFRDQFWTGSGQGADTTTSSVLDRAEFWIQQSSNQWLDAFKAGGNVKSTELASRTTTRTSLLMQVAHVVEMTPSQVPFQNGQTYYYLAVTLIPRFLWPEKPSVSEANQFYQKAYLFYNDKDLQRTSIAVGVMAEAYINFGWFGIVFIMLFVGIVLGLYERLFVSSHSNTLLLAIGTSMLPQFLVIEAQLAQYLSGIIQQVIFSFLVFLPITRRPSKLPLPQPQSMERVPIRLKPVAR